MIRAALKLAGCDVRDDLLSNRIKTVTGDRCGVINPQPRIGVRLPKHMLGRAKRAPRPATDPISERRPAKPYVDAIQAVTKAPIKYVVYSHSHFDHIAGGKPFKDLGATFVAHKNAKGRIAALKPDDVVAPRKGFDISFIQLSRILVENPMPSLDNLTYM
jgi:glyoxylase-like metal-dependent hydrolase (beta-lactamase superfamily II)